MSFNIGRALANTGIGLRAWGQAEQAQIVARQNQLAIQEQNRLDRLRQLSAREPIPQAPDVRAGLGEPTPVVEVPVAGPAAPAPAPAPAPPADQYLGRGEIIPPLASQPQPTYPPEGVPLFRPYQDPAGFTPPAGTTGPQNMAMLHQERLRRFADPRRTAQEDAAARQYREAVQPEPFDARTGFSVEPSASVVKPPAAKPTKEAKQYDNRKTPYDDLMAEAARQYGLDPVMFKRLIGTESSFNPNAVSPRGAQFGLGIAQIHSVHGLSDADRLNPQIAIPFAARLYSQYLREANGDHAAALMRYKGASSEQGRTAMQKPINTILSGTTAAETAPAATTPVETVAQETRKDPADFYQANQGAIPRDMQIALRNREELVRMASLYQQSGMGLQFMEVRARIMELDDSLFYLQGMQGLQEMTLANDPRRLSTVWSQATGMNVNVVPRTDGNFNIVVNGRTLFEKMSIDTVSDKARSSFDAAFRQQKGTASAEMAQKQFESMLKIQEGNASELAKMIRETTVEGVKGNNALTLEWAKANMSWDVRPTGDGNGTVIIRPPNSPPYVFNPTQRPVVIDGVTVPANSARLIGGLPQQTQARLNQVR